MVSKLATDGPGSSTGGVGLAAVTWVSSGTAGGRFILACRTDCGWTPEERRQVSGGGVMMAGMTTTDPDTASAEPTDSIEIDHPTLGPAVAIYDDRRKTRRKLLTAAGMAVVGAVGVFLGLGDIANGDGTGGSVFLLAGAGLLTYGINEARATLMRLRTVFSLVVGEGGFEYAFGSGSIAWDEVASVGFERVAGRGKPGAVRVQVNIPDEFAARHELSLAASLMLRINDGSLYVARGALMPAGAVLELMSARLAEFRKAHISVPAPAPARGIKPRTSRH
jgi:hypothetical protein